MLMPVPQTNACGPIQGRCRRGSGGREPGERRVAVRLLPDPSLASAQSLLLIILDNLRLANFRIVRVKPDVAKGTSLSQEIPALIQFNLDLREPLPIGFGVCPLLVQSVFLCDKALNMIEDWLIFNLILHESILSARM